MNEKKYGILEIAAAKVVLKIALPEDLVEAAADSLEAGLDSRSLRILAGLNAAEFDEAGSLFEQSIAELDISKPDKHDAVMQLAREYARQILSGRITPRVGGELISALSVIPQERLSELDTFVYGASEWEDRPEDGPIFEKGIIAAAKDLANS